MGSLKALIARILLDTWFAIERRILLARNKANRWDMLLVSLDIGLTKVTEPDAPWFGGKELKKPDKTKTTKTPTQKTRFPRARSRARAASYNVV